ncbi:hypothetical protein [Micromonospora fluostatini]|uniref:hypothetical protein n=1 Tax=Micromonospora sp. JCM 30529 TaxID=3421643 RepID=UPI003D174484
MRALAAASALMAVVLLGWGLFLVVGGDSTGVMLLVVGAVLAFIVAVVLPRSRRHGRT